MVSATDSDFINNERTAGFMKDDNPDGTVNKNRSRFVNCNFLNNDGTSEYGITNWAASTINVRHCEFNGMTKYAISSNDGGFRIRHSDFIGNTYGIYSPSSSPLLWSNLRIGGYNSADGNTFIGNTYGIYTSGVDDIIIANNEFDGCTVGFYATGQSEYILHENMFTNGTFGVMNEHTLSGLKDEKCNIFQGPLFSNYFRGNNEGVDFYNNHFTSDEIDVWIEDSEGFNGKLSHQGSTGSAVWNYFTDPTVSESHIVTTGATDPFHYFFPANPQEPRLVPRCSSNGPVCTGGSNNFNRYGTSGAAEICDSDPLFRKFCTSEKCLSTVRTKISDTKELLSEDLKNKKLLVILETLEKEKDYIIHYLVSDWLVKEKYDEIRKTFDVEESTIYKRKRMGLEIRLAQYTKARELLNKLPREIEDDQLFYTVQDLNILRLEKGLGKLSRTNIKDLENIADSNTNAAVYAQAIVVTLATGKLYEPILPKKGERARLETVNDEGQQLAVAPNPSTGLIQINMSKDVEYNYDIPSKIIVANMLGETIKEMDMLEQNEKRVIDMSNHPSGMYFIGVLQSDGVVSFTTKFILQTSR